MTIWERVLETDAAFPLRQVLGPLFILCALSLSSQDPLMLATAVIGLYLIATWRVRGLGYALFFLAAAAAVEHAFLTERQFLQFGIEGSLALSFFITALSFDQDAKEMQALASQIEARSLSVQHLEDELQRQREDQSAQTLVWQEKLAILQKEFDELSQEHSSLQVLNEVLRKSTALHIEEKQGLEEKLANFCRKESLLYAEIGDLQSELGRIGNESLIAIENKRLSQEINAVRIEREQTYLIQEALAKLQEKECRKNQELQQQLALLVEDKKNLADQLIAALAEASSFTSYMEQTAALREHSAALQQRLDAVQTERNFLKERLEKAEVELTLKKEAIPKEEIDRYEEKIASLAKFESLYKQLCLQFEEKNQVLHAVRVQLFKSDTELQTIKRERELKELSVDPFVEKAMQEMAHFNTEIHFLEKENQELESLISHLLSLNADPVQPFAFKVKKKMKTNPDQELLF